MKKAKILQPGEVERPYYLALSVRQPWAFAIAYLGKDRENRQWHAMPKYRGPLLIHASKGCTRREYDAAIAFMDSRGIFFSRHQRGPENTAKPLPPTFKELQLGGIVARVTLADIVDHWDDGHAFAPGNVGNVKCHNCGVEKSTASNSSALCMMPSRWQMDTSVGLVLKDREPLPFVPWKGALGFFRVDKAEYDEALLTSMGAALRGMKDESRRQAQSKMLKQIMRQVAPSIA